MKKSSVVNLSIVSFLLILCVTTLIVIYATVPETTIVLFEENFDSLEKKKWTHRAAECKEGDKSFRYMSANNEHRLLKFDHHLNRLMENKPNIFGIVYKSDGVLQFFANTEDTGKTKRETQSKCNSCISWQNGPIDCFSSKYSARFQTRSSFYVKCGQIEVRTRLASDHWINLIILIVSAKSDSETEALGGFVISRTGEKAGRNCSDNIRVFFGSESNQSMIESAIIDRDFHLYKMKWDDSKILFTLDQQILFEKIHQKEGNYSCSEEAQDVLVNEPVNIKLGVDLGDSNLKCARNHSAPKRSLTNQFNLSILDVDYIRFSKIYNNKFNFFNLKI